MLPTQAQDSVNQLPPKCDSAIVCVADRYRRRARVRRILIIVVVCCVFCVGLLVVWSSLRLNVIRASAHWRSVILDTYAFAFESFAEAGKPIPDNLADFVAANNAALDESSRLWIYRDWPVPEYRPAGHLDKGPYLVLILRPQAWNDGGTAVVFYAYPDGRRDTITQLSKNGLEIALHHDDRRRAVGRPSTGPS